MYALTGQRGVEYNGFTKADSMHLSFTYAFFKVNISSYPSNG